MPDFAYTARDTDGRKVSGRLSATSQREALAQLDQQALFPLEVAADQPATRVWRGRRINGQLMATTYGQLSDLLRSGVPLLRALEVLRQLASHAGLAQVLETLHDHVEEGG